MKKVLQKIKLWTQLKNWIKKQIQKVVDATKITNNKISKYFKRTKNNDYNEVINEVFNNVLENDDKTSSLKLSERQILKA